MYLKTSETVQKIAHAKKGCKKVPPLYLFYDVPESKDNLWFGDKTFDSNKSLKALSLLKISKKEIK